ncbi:MAG: 3'(2'),5'-bisphosphate nucleotidase CysQ [Candidatus Celerinatantimonas neptuna]|nr:MAG: 3'(2'),5'-bisphosphate nucleotidase CysQ [Candidatus Celerinatantimonas neptuna]
MLPDELKQREIAIKSIILAAGKTALEYFNNRVAGSFTLKGKQDFLTEADALVEQQIKTAIHEQFPDDELFGEETGGSIKKPSVWVIDPIDGTANFARDIPHFCISIAFVHEGMTELGAIYNPVTDELYQTRKGFGTTKNGCMLHVSAINDLNQASIEFGWSTRISSQDYLDAYQAILNSGANIRRSGSGALALAWVAEGRTDGYAELHMNAWDCLAGLLMVQEAGGCIGLFPRTHQEITQGGPVIAAAPGIASIFSQATKLTLASSKSFEEVL